MRIQSEDSRRRSDDERVLPLINVVFLLLIFFMLTGKISATDPFEVLPPLSVSEGNPLEQDILILIGPDGTLALDGLVYRDDSIFVEALEFRLDELELVLPNVRLKADGGADAVRLVQVMEMMRAVGIDRVRLLTTPEGR